MKKRGKKKSYSIAEKIAYYKARLQSPKTKENQKIYSKNWLDGVDDEYSKINLKSAEAEFEKLKSIKKINSIDLARYTGYINGMKANLKEKGGK